MTKVFNINLGGLPFTIDEDAYEALSSYLKTIHYHFRTSEGYEEITTDIEARMAELFQEKLGTRPIVSLKDVNGVIAIMGTPADFGAEPLEEEPLFGAGGQKTMFGKKWGMKTGKRLFKNPDEEVIAGVCSGISAYFGIADPLWIRLVFILLSFTGGFAIGLYIILWAILPKAETASDKLAMRGEPINASNIGRVIEAEFDHVSKKVSELSDEIKAEFGSKKKNTASQYEDSSGANASAGGHRLRAAASQGIHVLSTIIAVLGGIIRKLLELLFKSIRPLGFVIGVALLTILVLFWMFSVVGLFFGLPFSSFLYPSSPFLTALGMFNVLIFIGVPLLMLVLGVMRLFLRTNFKPKWTTGLWLFWGLNMLSLSVIAMKTMQQFSHGADFGLGANTDSFAPTDTLMIEFEKNPYEESFMHFGNDLSISDDKLISENIRLRIEKAEGDKMEIIQNNYSRGAGLEESQQLASKIGLQYRIEGNRLVVASFFEIPNGGKWRAQGVNLTLKIPEGKWVKTQNLNNWNHIDLQVDEQYAFPWWESDYAWKMGKDGLVNPDFAKEHEEKEQDLSFSNFSKIRLEGEVGLEIRQSGEYSVEFAEGEDQREDVAFRQEGDLLKISGTPNNKVVLHITVPNLTELWLQNAEDVRLYDFDLANFRLVNEGENRVELSANVNNLEVQLNGDNSLELAGNCNHLKAVLDREARMDAGQLSVRVADVTASNDSWVKISASDTLLQHFDESSNLVSKLKTSVVIQK